MSRAGRLVPGQGLPGAVLWKWEPPVPYIHRGLLGTSIFLYGSESDASQGANWGGSGFLVGISSVVNPSRTHLYAVSNDHVIHSCPVIRLIKVNGDPYILPGTDRDWESHSGGDDIAIRSLGAVGGGQYWSIGAEQILTQAEMDQQTIGPGDDCFMVGRYINRELEQFDRPVARFGNIAMMPERVYQEQRSFDQESYLVDMRSQAGFSGSPVVVYFEESGWRNLPDLPDDFEDATPETRVKVMEERVAGRPLSGLMSSWWLLGIEWGHLPAWGDVVESNQKFGRVQWDGGMAAVVPAWKLAELLDQETIRMGREKTEKELAKVKEGEAVLDASAPNEFDQFEDLTKKLIQVPKRELDEKRREQS